MAIRYLDGLRLRRSAAAAARWVGQRQENLNGINVFPVPDGDTGTNLAATLVSAVERAQRVRTRGIGAISRALADGALFGACGNSGAILAQFFEGFANELEGSDRADNQGLARAVQGASRAARGALSRPREGTILTVMQAWADRFVQCGGDQGADLFVAYQESLQAAREALARTPEQLKELRRAGVVDAGAQGFVYFLEGILHFAEGRIDGAAVTAAAPAAALARAEIPEDAGGITYRFCTECMVEGEELAVPAVREVVAPLGDSLVVAGSPRRLRIHVHTDDPEAVFTIGRGFGRVTSTKADDMRLQHAARFEREGVAIVTDTAADIPARELQRLKIHTVPLRVLLGSSVYLDKQTLDPDEVYDRLVRGERSVGTSQPPPGDYAALYDYLFEHYGEIVVVSLSAALSGTHGASERAAESSDSERITVIDSGTASIAQGLVVLAAAERAADGGSVDDVVAAALAARDRVRMLIAAPSLEYFIRGGRIGGWKARLAEWLGVVPLLTVPPTKGTPAIGGLARRGRAHRAALGKARAVIAAGTTPPGRIWVAHAAAPEVADACRDALAEAAPRARVDVLEVGPVLGAHAGPGAIAIGWLEARGTDPE